MKKKAENNSIELKQRRLKQGAVPSVFSENPPSMPINLPSQRYTKVSANQRMKKDQDRVDKLAEGYLAQQKIEDFPSLAIKIKAEVMPSCFKFISYEDHLLFISITLDSKIGPKIESSVQVHQDLSFTLFCHETQVPWSDVSHITPNGKIQNIDDVPNILAFLANFTATKKLKVLTVEQRIEELRKTVETDDVLVVSHESFNFSIEQLKLSLKSPNQRRYSPTLLAAALLWQNTSPVLYRLLTNVDKSVCLPSVRHLQRFGQNLSIETGITPSTVEYLKRRFSSLNKREQIVSILFDEVYSSRRCEYSNGHFFGYDEDHGTSKTVLCFMITGVASSYRDIVCMVPLSKINHEIINKWWWKVVEAVTVIGFRIVASISDGHSSNRKFFADSLKCGEKQSFVKNPYATAPNDKIFPFFDTIHILKGLYTNLLNKGEFECPSFEGKCLNPKTSHFCELYKSELGNPIRHASKLSHKVLYPLPIERSNVDLAVKFYHETTEAALEHFSELEGKEDWEKSSAFVNIVRRFFNCINVKSTHFESRKRDKSRKAVYRDNEEQLDFLRDFLNWVEDWMNMNTKKKLSSETFFTLRFTIRGLVELSEYIFETTDLEFILLGKINGDPIERRFGIYRQLSGANFFVSLKQFLESEKKLRIRSLIRFDKLSVTDLRKLCSDRNELNMEEAEREYSKLMALLDEPDSDAVLDLSTLNEMKSVIYHCSGYIARSIQRYNKCESCKELLFGDESGGYHVEIEENVEGDSSARSFLQLLNRGGLVCPSELVFLTTLFTIKLREEIFNNDIIRKILMDCSNPLTVFVLCFERRLLGSSRMYEVLNQICSNEHSFLSFIKIIARKTFNLTGKNFASAINDKVHEKRKRGNQSSSTPATRKIKKLSSD